MKRFLGLVVVVGLLAGGCFPPVAKPMLSRSSDAPAPAAKTAAFSAQQNTVAQTGFPAPQPIQPHATWTPPSTSIPQSFIEDAAFLLDHGLADPRKAVYRVVPSLQGEHRWVFPAANGKRAIAIELDGTIQSVDAVGSPVSLKADVLGIAEPKPFQQQGPNPFSNGYYSWTPVALLLIDNQPRLAEVLYNRLVGAEPGQYSSGEIFQKLAEPFLESRYWDANSAFTSGNFAEAVAKGRALESLDEACEERMRELKGDYWYQGQVRMNHRTIGLAFPKLASLPDVVAQAEAGASAKPVDLDSILRMPPQQRIAALIDAIPLISKVGMSNPGGPMLDMSPIYETLVKEGYPAVTPMLNDMATDHRLTTMYGNWASSQLMTVADVEARAISEIVKNGPPISAGDTSAFRKFWESQQGSSPAERDIAVLAEDSADPNRWDAAVEELFGLPENFGYPMDYHRQEARPNLFIQLGNSDQARTEDLLQKRIEGLVPQAKGMQADFRQKVAFDMAECLKEASSPAALQMLQEVSESVFGEQPSFGSFFLGSLVSSVTEDRVKLGDRSALTDYRQWIISFQPNKDTMETGNLSQALAPLNDYVDSPELKGVAEKVFLGSESPWNIDRIAKANPMSVDQFIENEKPNIPEVRHSFIQALGDGTVVAKTTMEADNVTVRSANGMMSMGVQNTAPDSRELPVGSTTPFRVCDAMAMAIARFDGSPAFKLSWAVKYRDEAIAKMSSWLQATKTISTTGLLGRT